MYTSLIKFDCDLCGASVTTADKKTPDGWIQLHIESMYVERSFITKHVCDHCMKDIKHQIENVQ